MQCEYSINLTVHNKDFLLEKVLQSIRRYTVGNYELVIVLDECTDNSENICIKWKNKFENFKLLYADNVFETRANNIAARASSGEFVIVVQDDVVVNEYGWNKRLSIPIKTFNDIFAVTARTAHNWIINPNSIDLYNDSFDANRWADILIATDHVQKEFNQSRNVFTVRNNVNRGPLLIKHDVLKDLDYLDEDYSPQELDDADLCYRAYKQFKMKCGVFWVDFISKLEWGGTRDKNCPNRLPHKWLLEANFKNSKLIVKRHFDMLTNNHNEERII